MAAFLSGDRVMQQSRGLTTATDVGREFLETVKFLGYDKLVVGSFNGAVPDAQDVATGFPPSPYPLTRRDNEDFVLRVFVEQQTVVTRLVRVEVWWRHHHTQFATMVHK